MGGSEIYWLPCSLHYGLIGKRQRNSEVHTKKEEEEGKEEEEEREEEEEVRNNSLAYL